MLLISAPHHLGAAGAVGGGRARTTPPPGPLCFEGDYSDPGPPHSDPSDCREGAWFRRLFHLGGRRADQQAGMAVGVEAGVLVEEAGVDHRQAARPQVPRHRLAVQQRH